MVTTTLYTAEDLLKICTSEQDYELIEGELAPMAAVSLGHGDIQANIVFALTDYERQHEVGSAFGNAGFLLERNPDSVLEPDASFITKSRIPEDKSGFVALAPDLAVEVISPSNSPGEIERKIAIYLRSGVRMVWIVYPEEREVAVYSPMGPPQVLKEQDTIDGGDVLPRLSLPVAEIFR